MQSITKILVAAVITLAAILLVKACLKEKKQVTTIEHIEQIKQDSTSFYRDLFNTEHAIREVSEANLTTVQTKYNGLLDSIAKREKVKQKDIKAVTTVGTVIKGTVIPEITPFWNYDREIDTFNGNNRVVGIDKGIDPPHGYFIHYGDSWISLNGRVGDSSSITYQVRDSIILTTYTKRKGIFGRKEMILDGYSINPAVHITGITGIRITAEKPKRFGIGPYLGYGWDGNRWAPTAGISVHYSLINF